MRQFDVEYGGIVNVLKTTVKVSEAFDPKKDSPDNYTFNNYEAVWDTGATNTVITGKVVASLNLKPIGKTRAIGVNSSSIVNAYLINLILPNNVAFYHIRVAELPVQGADVLIGMDVIRYGDFAISNVGKTRFSFRIPSVEPNILPKKTNQ